MLILHVKIGEKYRYMLKNMTKRHLLETQI